MKKITLLVFSLMTLAFVSNAQIDNGDFENWTDSMIGAYTYDSLIHWKTTDLPSQQNGDNHPHSAQPTTDAYASPTAILLTSWSAAAGIFPGIPGAASNGDVYVNLAGMTIAPIGGVPDNVRHASLMGYYKYEPAGAGDIGSIEVCLFKRNGANRDTVASGMFNPQLTISSYSLFTINLTPNSTDTPDSSLIWIQSSPRSPLGSGKTGTKLYVDSLYYQGIIGVNEISPLVKSMITYPVPAANDLNVRLELVSPMNMNYSVENITGKTVLSGRMNGSEQKIDVSNLSNGHYVVNVNDESGQKMISHKFTVAH